MSEPMQVPAINRIDKQLSFLDPESQRALMLRAVRDFRSSWLDVGRLLIDVAYGGDYKEWGYEEFELYCARELGLKKPTVKKLMVSYNYMKSRHQALLERSETAAPGEEPAVPEYQTVELLHRAHENNTVDEAALKEVEARVFAGDGEEGLLRKEIKGLCKEATLPEMPAYDRRKELADILRTARTLRKKVVNSSAVPGGMKDRLEQMLVEMEGLD